MNLLFPKHIDEKFLRDVIVANEGRGIAIKGITIEQYHDGPGLSSSDIKEIVNGTIESWLYKKANPEDPTRPMIVGNAIHTATLEGDEFWNRYCKEDEAPAIPARSTKNGKELWTAYCELFGKTEMTSAQWAKAYMKWQFPKFTKIPLSLEEIEMCFGIAANIKKHPMVSQMFSEGDSEVSMYWIDSETGILCKARADRLNYTFPCIPDIKSCQDASLDAFEADITNYDYHVSAWWYLEGARQAHQKDFENFVYIPAEKKPPYQIAFYTADEGSLAIGEGLCRAALAIYSRYLNQSKGGTKEVWTGHSLEPKSAGVRPYAFNKLSQVIHAHDLQGMGLEKFVGVV